jgi:predicted flap endonuclease-1-like 5' DNA nuclease
VLQFFRFNQPPPLLTVSLQTQTEAGSEGQWWFWLVLLLILSLVVAWLLQREAGQVRATLTTTTPAPTDHHPPVSVPPAPNRSQTIDPVLTEEVSSPAANPTPVVAAMPPESHQSKPAPTLSQSEVAVAPPASAVAAVAVAPDDLTRIEGIGPKIKSVLQAAGVATFADLANTEVESLKKILVDAGLRIHNPASWPEQAALAAAGQWDELKALQERLSAGRRN